MGYSNELSGIQVARNAGFKVRKFDERDEVKKADEWVVKNARQCATVEWQKELSASDEVRKAMEGSSRSGTWH